MSGVGISFGLDRIYLVVEELNLSRNSNGILRHCLLIMVIMRLLRHASYTKFACCWYKVELYPDNAKWQNNFNMRIKYSFCCCYCWRTDRIKLYSLKNLLTEQVLVFEKFKAAVVCVLFKIKRVLK
jgi:hypothetical protein